jgi:hypothetical protein
MLDLAPNEYASSYRDFIKEAFIDPIRTAIIVDDEYPTLDELLLDADEAGGERTAGREQQQKKHANRKQVRQILQFCRAQKPTPWLVDVHDGKTPTVEGEIASVTHLESSDLLILDYHLDPSYGSDKAIDILRRLAGNGHFNLVVVYTRDRDVTGTGIDRTINEIALSLASASPNFQLNHGKLRAFEIKMEAWEGVDEGIAARLMASVDEIAFLKVLEHEDCKWESIKDSIELIDLKNYIEAIPSSVDITPDQVLSLIMHKRQTSFVQAMSHKPYGRVTIGKTANEVNWIRVDTLFVTVISKEHEPSTIPDKLLDALEAWDPVPHRLLMSKMRSALAVEGVMAESNILMNRHLQAGWLSEVLETDDAKRHTSVRQNVARHWESLGGKIEPKILDFADRVATYLAREKEKQDLLARFDKYAAHSDKAHVHLQMNIHACSKPVEGHHLSTGHILRIGNGAGQQCQYWLCLTPACDLEPGQGASKGWGKRLGTWLPFKAVRLYPAATSAGLKYATRGYHVFFNENGKSCVYGFTELSVNSVTPTLSWEQFFVADQGRFADLNMLEVASIGKNLDLSFDKRQAVVVAQLRYEYALNLMQRLGAHLSRVGLDFTAYSEPDAAAFAPN